MQLARRPLLRSLAVLPLFAIGQFGCTAGLTALQSVLNLISYVTTFLQLVQGVWSVVSAQLPTSVQSVASTAIEDAVSAVAAAQSLAQDAIQAFEAGTGPTPNYAALTAAIQAAVAALVAVYQQYVSQVPATSAIRTSRTLSAYQGEMQREWTSIAHWQVGK